MHSQPETRLELILDKALSAPSSQDKKSIELRELERLYATSTDEKRRASLREEIDVLSGVTPGRKTAKRPWSARPMSARRTQVLNTIPEAKQDSRHTLGKQRRSFFPEKTSLGHDFTQRRNRTESLSSLSSEEEEEEENNNNNNNRTEDDALRLDLRYAWSTAHDPRFPVQNVLDRSTFTFWSSSGLLPHLLGLHFSRNIILSRLLVSCAGVTALRLKCLSKKNEWLEIYSPTSKDDSNLWTEFVFDLQPLLATKDTKETFNYQTSTIILEILASDSDFVLVRELYLIEPPGHTGDRHKYS